MSLITIVQSLKDWFLQIFTAEINVKRLSNTTKIIFNCKIANFSPKHILGPCPKLKYWVAFRYWICFHLKFILTLRYYTCWRRYIMKVSFPRRIEFFWLRTPKRSVQMETHNINHYVISSFNWNTFTAKCRLRIAFPSYMPRKV